MKAMILENFGALKNLKLASMPAPELEADQVEICVVYAAVNPIDWKICEGHLAKQMPYQFPIILGWDVAGSISKVGKNVKNFKIGNAVFAYARKPTIQMGAFAEYICLNAKNVVPKPRELSFKEAAAIPLISLTPWQALEAAKLKAGQTILIHAGAGGVGSMAIQFAKHLGANVITTASQRHHSYVKQLGADVIIDYTQEDFAKRCQAICPHGVDAVLDTVGGNTLRASYTVVKPKGYLVAIAEEIPAADAKKYGFISASVFVQPDAQKLREIANLLDAGIVVPPTIEEMPLERAVEALEKLKAGHTQGKIVLKVAHK